MTFFRGRKKQGRNFVGVAIHFGGFGASQQGDGETGLSFPFNSGNIPIEVAEIDAAIFYTRKELLVDSGGPGEFRGGLGQRIELCIPDGDLGPDGPVIAGLRGSSRFPDSSYPVFGRLGGGPGRGAGLFLNGEPVAHGLQWQLKPGDTVQLSVPGGGGFGAPLRRAPERVANDVKLGLVSRQGAIEDYGVVLTDSLEIDLEKTNAERDTRLKQAAT
jgi:N-methylhydantoinase B/oxoprolinase/acetone carboxylase alpha subunit